MVLELVLDLRATRDRAVGTRSCAIRRCTSRRHFRHALQARARFRDILPFLSSLEVRARIARERVPTTCDGESPSFFDRRGPKAFATISEGSSPCLVRRAMPGKDLSLRLPLYPPPISLTNSPVANLVISVISIANPRAAAASEPETTG